MEKSIGRIFLLHGILHLNGISILLELKDMLIKNDQFEECSIINEVLVMNNIDPEFIEEEINFLQAKFICKKKRTANDLYNDIYANNYYLEDKYFTILFPIGDTYEMFAERLKLIKANLCQDENMFNTSMAICLAYLTTINSYMLSLYIDKDIRSIISEENVGKFYSFLFMFIQRCNFSEISLEMLEFKDHTDYYNLIKEQMIKFELGHYRRNKLPH